MENDLKEFMAAVERHLSDPKLRLTDTPHLISSIETKCRESRISDNDKLELARLGRALLALMNNSDDDERPPGTSTI